MKASDQQSLCLLLRRTTANSFELKNYSHKYICLHICVGGRCLCIYKEDHWRISYNKLQIFFMKNIQKHKRLWMQPICILSRRYIFLHRQHSNDLKKRMDHRVNFLDREVGCAFLTWFWMSIQLLIRNFDLFNALTFGPMHLENGYAKNGT